MRLLIDTHVLIALAHRPRPNIGAKMASALQSRDNVSFASAASFWEIAIKTRIGKLETGMPLNRLAEYFEAIGINLIAIDHRHAVHAVDPEPATRDPFDRLLLAQCVAENLRLVTLDRALMPHPLAWHGE